MFQEMMIYADFTETSLTNRRQARASRPDANASDGIKQVTSEMAHLPLSCF